MSDHDRRSHTRPAPLSLVRNVKGGAGTLPSPRGCSSDFTHRTAPDTLDAVRRDMDAPVGGSAQLAQNPVQVEQVFEFHTADAARTLHLRRQLAAAVDHGTEMLAVLGLPRLVTPDFVPIDLRAAGDAIEAAVAALDALDGDADLEPWLGWTAAGAIGGGDDSEHDTTDAEHDLGWSALHSQLRLGDNTPDGDLTAPERAGRGFVRCAPDDAEDDDPAERDDHHGCESEPAPWRCAWSNAVQIAARLTEAVHG